MLRVRVGRLEKSDRTQDLKNFVFEKPKKERDRLQLQTMMNMKVSGNEAKKRKIWTVTSQYIVNWCTLPAVQDRVPVSDDLVDELWGERFYCTAAS